MPDVQLRHPTGIELLYPVVFALLLAIELRGETPPPPLELALLLALFVMLCLGLVVEGLLGSPAYAVLGGTLIVALGALRAAANPLALLVVLAGTAATMYGVRQWVLTRGTDGGDDGPVNG